MVFKIYASSDKTAAVNYEKNEPLT